METLTQSCRNLLHNLSFDYGAPSLAPSVSILLTHGTCMCILPSTLSTLRFRYQLRDDADSCPFFCVTADDMVPFPFGRKSSETLRMAGFPVTFIPNEGSKHELTSLCFALITNWFYFSESNFGVMPCAGIIFQLFPK